LIDKFGREADELRAALKTGGPDALNILKIPPRGRPVTPPLTGGYFLFSNAKRRGRYFVCAMFAFVL